MSATTSSINSTNIISDSAKMATLAAKAAGIQVGANGEPIIKNGSEYQAFQLKSDPKLIDSIQTAKVAVDAVLDGYRAFDKDVTNWVGNGIYNKFSTTWNESSIF